MKQRLLPFIFYLCEEHEIPATFFELTTALAFLKFQHARCDCAVLEVGLGGRLDATNVIARPALSIVTCVQMDHVGLLGNTLEEIALEKAGIIKAGINVLVGPDLPLHILQVTNLCLCGMGIATGSSPK